MAWKGAVNVRDNSGMGALLKGNILVGAAPKGAESFGVLEICVNSQRFC